MRNADCHVEGTMAYAQREAIERTLLNCSYNLTRSAEQLRIGRTTLYRLVNHYCIKIDNAARIKSSKVKRINPSSVTTNVVLIGGNWYLVSNEKSARETRPSIAVIGA